MVKKILKHLKDNWIRHGFETLVVVIGVLIAFGINTWWEGLNEKKLQKALIEALRSDLEASRKQFDFIAGRHIHVQKSLEEIITCADNGTIPEDGVIRFDSLIGSTFN